ncbi:MAG: baseplate J/gp47 family protein [Methanothrix sp.]|nr:baseplate J/gp47 family protein [Methanothrix sp.]
MTLPLENLDNKTFNDLVNEAIARIPVYAPEWTDHNRSDPGITLIELFAWLAEMQIYGLNKINDGNFLSFLKLCGIEDDGVALEEKIVKAKKGLKGINRAVTSADYEHLAMQVDGVARAKAIPLFHPNMKGDVPNTVSAIILPDNPDPITILKPIVIPKPIKYPIIINLAKPNSIGTKDLLRKVYNNLNAKRPLAIELFILYPEFIEISITAKIVKRQEYLDENVVIAVASALDAFLDPMIGGPDGNGWPFGRPVYISEIYEVIDNVDGVDYVKSDLCLNNRAANESIEIPDHALVSIKDLIISVIKEA